MILADKKLNRLESAIAETGGLAVAFSAGVDSTFLLAVSKCVLGDDLLAVTCDIPVVPRRELESAKRFCESRGIRLALTSPDVLTLRAFTENPVDRCYHCKRAIMLDMLSAARKNGFRLLAEGTNADDISEYRPGMRAIAELGISSPLAEAGLTKDEIRALSKKMGLPTWDKPSFACLATRIEHGAPVTREVLSRVEAAEEYMASLGFPQYRVRIHGELARIEVDRELIPLAAQNAARISEALSALGFKYVSLDLSGFRSGSMSIDNGSIQ